mmetsp:Transcript_8561/g.28208  ORF Transcript_8561/g.28208 Transcript_8561/m.28208 type:complete len:444 (-) Transcript_8561:129-1460(-)
MHGMGGLVAIAALLQTPHRAPTLGRCPCVAPQAALPVPGQPAPILLYFGTQLDKGKLNAIESLALAKLVIPQRKQALLQKWISEEKLECTQELGDLIKTVDAELALKTYLRATARAKVIECLVQARQLNHVIAYCQTTNHQPDWSLLVANIVRVDPEEALAFARKLTTADGVSIDFDAVADAFIQHNCMQQATSFLLEAVRSNRADKALLRARLFEIRSVLQTADTAAGNAQNTGHRGPNNSASWPTSTATTSAHLLSELGDLFAFLSLSGKQMVVEWCVQQGVDDVAELFDCEFAAVLATSLDLSDTDRTRLVALLGPHSPEPTPTGSASSNSNAGAQAPPHADESSPEGGASSSLIASAQAPTDEGGSRQEVVASSSANAGAQTSTVDVDRNLCKICFTNDREMLFKPCRHLQTCRMCCRQLKSCPWCRTPIKKFEQVYGL